MPRNLLILKMATMARKAALPNLGYVLGTAPVRGGAPSDDLHRTKLHRSSPSGHDIRLSQLEQRAGEQFANGLVDSNGPADRDDFVHHGVRGNWGAP